MLGPGWTEVVALVAAYVIAALATPAGISGAVLPLPFQVSVLGTPSPAVTPTNLLYNVVATPGALYRYFRQGQTGGRLALVLIAGTVPGVIAGSVIRVEVLPGSRVFALVVAAVLVPLGTWLTFSRPSPADRTDHPARLIPVLALALALAAAVGCVGGMLRDRGRLDPGARLDRVGPEASRGRSRCPGLNVRDLGRWRDHFHDFVYPRTRLGGSGLADGIALGVGGLAVLTPAPGSSPACLMP